MKAFLVFTLFSLISFGALAQITYSVPVPHELDADESKPAHDQREGETP